MFVPLERVAFHKVAQCDQHHLIIRDFNAHIAMTRHRCLDTDARRRQRQSQVIGEGGDLIDTYFGAPTSCLDKKWLHTELCDGRTAIGYYYLHWRAEGG